MRQNVVVVVAGAVAILAVFTNCSGRISDGVADAGQALLDAVGFDAADAAGGGEDVVVTALCDQSSDLLEGGSDYAKTITTHYASVDVPGIRGEDAPKVTAVGCGRACLGDCPPRPCAEGATCTAIGPDLDNSAVYCQPLAARIATDELLIPCGTETTIDFISGTDRHYGAKVLSVHVRVEQ